MKMQKFLPFLLLLRHSSSGNCGTMMFPHLAATGMRWPDHQRRRGEESRRNTEPHVECEQDYKGVSNGVGVPHS